MADRLLEALMSFFEGPEGISRRRRQEFESQQAELNRRNQLLQQAISSGYAPVNRLAGQGGTFTTPSGANVPISIPEITRLQGQPGALPNAPTFRLPGIVGEFEQAPMARQVQQAELEEKARKAELFPLEKEKLSEETSFLKSQGKFYESFLGTGVGEDGMPGVVVSIDETGDRVEPGTPGARQILVQPTKSGPKLTLLPQPTPERVQAQSAIDSMLESLDAMEQMLAEDPTRLIRSNIPFVEREFKAVVDQFDKEAAIAAGGKQLTQTELNLIRRTRPTFQDVNSPEAIRRKIAKLRQIGTNAKARLAGTTPQKKTEEPDPLGLR